ncbi:hypothetical protein VNO77_26893 [Canavalia gladiata]|uniref:Uncharacterized protein n=1 Tax=Canavalia gladiata TaxID=3824 RepID=A0AAN9Q5Z4_CANGL
MRTSLVGEEVPTLDPNSWRYNWLGLTLWFILFRILHGGALYVKKSHFAWNPISFLHGLTKAAPDSESNHKLLQGLVKTFPLKPENVHLPLVDPDKCKVTPTANDYHLLHLVNIQLERTRNKSYPIIDTCNSNYDQDKGGSSYIKQILAILNYQSLEKSSTVHDSIEIKDDKLFKIEFLYILHSPILANPDLGIFKD